jgi:hypothetical protein
MLATTTLAVATGFAQGTLSTILINGPVSNRVNVVILSEGYTTNQLGQFLVNATNLLNNLLGTMPYQEYSSYFNAYAISVASAQAGSDHPPSQMVDTYFNSVYEYSDYVITIPPNGYDANLANGQGKVDTLVANLMPQADIVVLLVNDLSPGGSSGFGGPSGISNRRPIISALNLNLPNSDIAAHESGHFFAGLVDEYTNAVVGYVPVETPNSTSQTSSNLIKWNAWIEAGTPIPTPNSYAYAGSVGLFLGAQYQTAHWYRPKFDCKMNHLTVDFCEVCSEQIVKTIYQNVRPLDGFTPASSNLTADSTQAVAFAVTPLQPLTHDLQVLWYTNGVAVGGATNSTFQFWPGQTGNGTHTVRAIVQDPTSLVRNDPLRLLNATSTWSVIVSLNKLQLTSPLLLSGGRFRFTVAGTAPQGFVVQASTNFASWVRLSTNTLTAGKLDYTNSGIGGMPYRYYRTVSPP